jgi:hypothetical protein
MPKPLPLGPVHLALADVVFMAIVVTLQSDRWFSLLRVPLLFLTGYLAVMCAGLWSTGPRVNAYIIAFGLGLVIRLWEVAWAATAVAALLYPIAYIGLRQALAGFPWSKQVLLSARSSAVKLTMSTDLGQWVAQRQIRSLGWPFDLLRPNQPPAAIPWRDGTALSLLGGWWAYAIAAPLEPRAQQGVLYFILLIGAACMALIRLNRYTANYRPPINAWGRLITLRWIVPGYDKVLIAPILAFAIPWIAIGWFIEPKKLDPLLVAPIALAGVCMVVLNFGPTLHNWRHTGNHRIAPKYNSTTHLQL